MSPAIIPKISSIFPGQAGRGYRGLNMQRMNYKFETIIKE
jgi:hypothetical protein